MKEKKGPQKLCKLHCTSLKLFLILLYFKLHTVNPAIFWHGISNAIDKYFFERRLLVSFGVSAPPRLQFRVRTLLGICCIVELNEKLYQGLWVKTIRRIETFLLNFFNKKLIILFILIKKFIFILKIQSWYYSFYILFYQFKVLKFFLLVFLNFKCLRFENKFKRKRKKENSVDETW